MAPLRTRGRSRHHHGSPASWTLDDGRRRADRFEVATDDGARLVGVDAGPVDGAPIVLAHCWTGDRSVWEPVAARLAADHRVVVWDQRGHGASTEGRDLPSIERLGADLLAVADRLDLGPVALAGHSMGGMTALAATLAAPERVTSLSLLSTSAAPSAWPTGVERALPTLVASVGSETLDRRLAGRGGPAIVRGALGRGAHRAAIECTRRTFAATPAPTRAAWLQAIAAFDVHDRLGEVGCPTAIVVGRLDTLLPVPHSSALHAAIADSSLTVLPGAGHMLPLERADAVADLITSLPARQGALR